VRGGRPMGPSAVELRIEVAAALARGRGGAAVRVLRRLVRLAPEDPEALGALGYALVHLGRRRAALAALRQAWSLPGAPLWAGALLARLQAPEDPKAAVLARDLLDRLLSGGPSRPSPLDVEALAEALRAVGDARGLEALAAHAERHALTGASLVALLRGLRAWLGPSPALARGQWRQGLVRLAHPVAPNDWPLRPRGDGGLRVLLLGLDWLADLASHGRRLAEGLDFRVPRADETSPFRRPPGEWGRVVLLGVLREGRPGASRRAAAALAGERDAASWLEALRSDPGTPEAVARWLRGP
jgi:tetratricopeptide (TPR) repeat protein